MNQELVNVYTCNGSRLPGQYSSLLGYAYRFLVSKRSSSKSSCFHAPLHPPYFGVSVWQSSISYLIFSYPISYFCISSSFFVIIDLIGFSPSVQYSFSLVTHSARFSNSRVHPTAHLNSSPISYIGRRCIRSYSPTCSNYIQARSLILHR